MEEGQPDYIEQNVNSILKRNDVATRVHGKDCLSMAGEYTCERMEEGLRKFLGQWAPAAVARPPGCGTNGADLEELERLVPQRPSGLCTGCPERPFFSAVNLIEKEFGKLQVSMDIGCHSFATAAPFNIGNTITGYGLGPSSASALMGRHEKRALSIMGDGGFWHNGLTTGIGNAVENEHDEGDRRHRQRLLRGHGGPVDPVVQGGCGEPPVPGSPSSRRLKGRACAGSARCTPTVSRNRCMPCAKP